MINFIPGIIISLDRQCKSTVRFRNSGFPQSNNGLTSHARPSIASI